MPDKGPSPYPSMMKIQVNNQGVVKLLRGLRPFKATGPDEIPAYILKNMADHLAIFVLERCYSRRFLFAAFDIGPKSLWVLM
jgi:hypothetical protein